MKFVRCVTFSSENETIDRGERTITVDKPALSKFLIIPMVSRIRGHFFLIWKKILELTGREQFELVENGVFTGSVRCQQHRRCEHVVWDSNQHFGGRSLQFVAA